MKFKILHLITTLSTGGVENMLYKIVTRYDRERFLPIVCCIKSGGEVAERLKEEGIKVIILERMKRHGFDWIAVKEVYRILKKHSIHILRTHQYHANLYGRIAGALAKTPVIVPSFHNLYESPERPKLHRRLINRILVRWSDRIVAVSEAIARDIVRFDRVRLEKIKVIPNGVVLEDFSINLDKVNARKEFGFPDNGFIIGSVGRLTPQKGHEYLIRAVTGMKNLIIAIAGDGPLKEKLSGLAKELGVKCFFTGTIPQERIPFFLKSLDLFCFPSLWEGMPSALIEAMAAGVPIIASDIKPNADVLMDSGILFKPGDVSALRNSISRLSSSNSLRENLSRSALEQAQRFSIDNTVKEYERLFFEILREKKLL